MGSQHSQPSGRRNPPPWVRMATIASTGGDPGSADLASQHEELLAEQGVLRDELGTGADGVVHHPRELTEAVPGQERREEGEHHRQHGPRP